MFAISHHDVSVDAKGRFLFPSSLKKRLSKEKNIVFIIKKGFEGCIDLYTKTMWLPIAEKISMLNDFDEQDREFKRLFFEGAMELELDSAGRLLIPKILLDYAKIMKDIYIKSLGNKIELWSKDVYDNLYSEKSSSNQYISKLSNSVLGNTQKNIKND